MSTNTLKDHQEEQRYQAKVEQFPPIRFHEYPVRLDAYQAKVKLDAPSADGPSAVKE